MNKTAQNLTWNCLPLEVKKEVKRQYQIAINVKEYYTECTLEYLFGIDNLTSDAEGEEMLTCEKSKAMRLYSHLLDLVENERMSEHYSGWCDLEREYIALFGENVFADYFGSKCLPDEDAHEDNFVKSEPKPAEPKFKKWDKVLVKADTAISKDMEIYKILPSEIKRIDGETALIGMLPNVMICDMQVRLGNLEPYTEPTQQPTTDCSNLDKQASTCTNVCTSQSAPNPNPETVRNLRKSDEDSESEALLNQIPDTAKMVDNIIKDGFRDHNRLHIASIAMAGILAAPLDNVGFITNKCVDDVAEYALRCADALLELTANTTKGGSK